MDHLIRPVLSDFNLLLELPEILGRYNLNGGFDFLGNIGGKLIVKFLDYHIFKGSREHQRSKGLEHLILVHSDC